MDCHWPFCGLVGLHLHGDQHGSIGAIHGRNISHSTSEKVLQWKIHGMGPEDNNPARSLRHIGGHPESGVAFPGTSLL